MSYTELQVTTNFSFLRGASHPEEMGEQASLLGYKSIAVTDVNTLAGIVRAYAACKKFGIRLITGCHLQFVDGTGLLVYPVNKKGYSELCELITTGNLRTEKGQCLLYKQDAFDHLQNAIAIALPPAQLDEQFELSDDFNDCIKEYKKHFRDRLYMAIQRRYRGDDAKLLHRVVSLAATLQIPVVATNDVYYHIAERRQLQDVMVCIREKCNIYNAGFRLYTNAERYLKPEAEIKRLFRQYPAAVNATNEIVQTCNFSLDELQYEYPEELTSQERTPQEELEYHVWKGAAFYFGNDVPQKAKDSIVYELNFIEKMDYASYFLTVFDIVRYARSRGILCQGRGSAANSTVCYCLGITSVNPLKFELLFERFLSTARNEPPDIDVDFEHERREEVIQYIYENTDGTGRLL